MSSVRHDATSLCREALACIARRDLPGAILLFERARALDPDAVEALNGLGVAFAQSGRRREAIECLGRAVELAPRVADLRINLAMVQRESGECDAAVATLREALAVSPGNHELHNLLGLALGVQGLHAEAQSHFLEALRLQPRFAQAHSNLLLSMNYPSRIAPARLAEEHRFWERLHGQGLQTPASAPVDRDPDRRLRIGYVSPDFREHAAARFILPIFRAHDRSQVEVHAYAQLQQADAMTRTLQSLADRWRPVAGLDDAQLVKQIRDDRIDILVDLAGHTAGNRLGAFAHRPAPVQLSYLGYPNTTGLGTIDARLVDAITDPAGDTHWHSERLLRLPGAWCCYEPPAEAPPVGALPARDNGFVTFAAFHSLAKLDDALLDTFAEVLHATPGARLMVFRNTLDRSVAHRLAAHFARRGIAPERLRLERLQGSGADYLGMYREVDLQLDAFPWNGHATTCESLWMGVPVVSLCGERHATRMGASLLAAVGLPELVARSRAAYVALASALARDVDRLGRLRASLRDRVASSPLCDAVAFTRGLEAAYRELWRERVARD